MGRQICQGPYVVLCVALPCVPGLCWEGGETISRAELSQTASPGETAALPKDGDMVLILRQRKQGTVKRDVYWKTEAEL